MDNNFLWWKNAVIYQIYIKSFQDTTGNGIGDLCGIIKRLDYIKLLGVDAIWLTPFYKSPQIDNGYDVSDYVNIDPLYGNFSDFSNLIIKAHKLKIRIILDMVFNHSSTNHPWFIKSLNPKSPYRQYYIWRNPSKEGGLPNNWKSKFGGNAWCWHEKSSQYYMHLWSKEQADLNWDNKKVRNEIKKIINFWINKGIDGIRLDVINLVSKPKNLPNDINGDGLRLYTDGPHIHEYIQEINREVFSPSKIMTVGEMSSATLEHCQKYSALNGKELSMVFSFDHVEVDFYKGNKWVIVPLDLIKLKNIFFNWQTGMYQKAWNALFWCNHDQPRIVSRWGDENIYRIQSAKLFAIILHGMQGTPYIYQGEEIGMTNPNFIKIFDYRDVETYNIYNKLRYKKYNDKEIFKILIKKSRDNARTPMQWNNTINSGFTNGTPWIQVNKNFKKINVNNAIADYNSIFYTYKNLIQLRKNFLIITYGNYSDLCINNKNLWCYKRTYKDETLIVIANISNKINNWSCEILKNKKWSILINNYNIIRKNFNSIKLQPYEAMWLYKKEKN